VVRGLLQRVERVNGVGWFIGMIVQVAYITAAMAALYFGLVRKNDAVLAQVTHNAFMDSTRAANLSEKVDAQSRRIGSLWKRAQSEHKEMMRRNGLQWDTHEE